MSLQILSIVLKNANQIGCYTAVFGLLGHSLRSIFGKRVQIY